MIDTEISQLMRDNYFEKAFELLSAHEHLTAEGWFHLAVCSLMLKYDYRETASLFDRAESLGFDGYWLFHHRASIRAAIGDHAGALRDALKALASNPLPELIELAIQQMSLFVTNNPDAMAEELQNSLVSLIPAVWSHVAKLRARVELSNPQILRVDKGDFDAFVLRGDVSARPTPDDKQLPAAPLKSDQFVTGWYKTQDVLLLLVAWYAAHRIPSAFLDIGSNIGTDAIRVAKFTRLIDEQVPIAAFEPGITAALVPRNLQLNGVEGLVRFEAKCVSASEEPVLLFGEPGVSVNNRIVNRNLSTEGFSKIVDSTTITDYLAKAKFRRRHPILKIDTQGAEWFVWQGMREEVPHRWFSMIIELTPSALQSTVSPRQFVCELLDSFFVFDLGLGRRQFTSVGVDGLDHWLVSISEARHHWTDLLCISRALPSARELIDRIAAAHAAREAGSSGNG